MNGSTELAEVRIYRIRIAEFAARLSSSKARRSLFLNPVHPVHPVKIFRVSGGAKNFAKNEEFLGFALQRSRSKENAQQLDFISFIELFSDLSEDLEKTQKVAQT